VLFFVGYSKAGQERGLYFMDRIFNRQFDKPGAQQYISRDQSIVKRIVFVLICILSILTLLPVTAKADIGPKPSIVIDFIGLDDKEYYVTLLSSVESTGPYWAVNNSKDPGQYKEGDEDYEIYVKFADYLDKDGYYFLQYFKDCSQTHQFSWTYYPPREFKILLYFPETDSFIVSDTSYERYAFNSYFIAEVTNTGLSVVESYDATNETLSLIARIVLTIVIELIIALLFGFRGKKQFRFIAIVNIITQIGLNLILNIVNYHAGQLAFLIFFILLEFVIVIVEAVLYTFYLRRHSQIKVPGWKPGVYALVANFASFVLGLVLAIWIPGIF
jgi:hypothetical protein